MFIFVGLHKSKLAFRHFYRLSSQINSEKRRPSLMTSQTTEKQILSSSCSNSLFRGDPAMLSFQSPTNGHIMFNHCSTNNNDPSNLFALTMINQALNFIPPNNVDSQLKTSTKPFQDMQKMVERGILNSQLSSEYLRLKTKVEQSGLLSPRESLTTKHRGSCFWAHCTFHSDIEETFKKHMSECHQLTSSALAQLEISLEKSLQLSAQLLKEQNHLYNMMLHLDQKIKCLPGESAPLSDYQYLSLLLNKFKQTTNMMDLISDNAMINNDMTSSSHGSQPPILHTNNHTIPYSQYPSSINKSQPNLSQQLLDNFSSALLRQQPLHLPAQNTSYPSSIFSTSQTTPSTYTFSNDILPIFKSESNESPFVLNNVLDTLPNGKCNHQLNTIDNNLKDMSSQPRSSDSNYPRSDSATSTYVKEKKIKSLRKSPFTDQGPLLSKNMSDREYYRQYAVRPSASYVNLIKTAILESPRRELSLNEIYVWMQSEFSYFRDKEQKWKNAIRHNLSLHKCFQRKHGKLWTFNELEYNLKKSRNRFQYNVPINGSEPNIDGDEYDDDEMHNVDLECQDGFIKKEEEYNDENIPTDVVDTDEWSNYLHKNPLKSSSSTVDISMLPNLKVDRCPTTSISSI